MAQISLRSYNREIEKMIDSGHNEEAIAHCRHILDTYPKHIQTYRLLGKAYLEQRRFADARDVFQRVLASVPDDFTAHLGMSFYYSEQNDLNKAIWHMERAFEVQPANALIQDELRKLFIKRDGKDPGKIHLTRGALARMYARGSLHQQAINELRLALKEEPKRPDLQVLLARMYLQAGKRVEAAEAASLLLTQLPFCLEANLILSEILATTDRANETEDYLFRVQALDPYAAHISSRIKNPDDVPDSAVTIEKLDWIPTSGGFDSGRDWAASMGMDFSQVSGPPEPAIQAEEQPAVEQPEVDAFTADIPDWLKQAQPTAEEQSVEPVLQSQEWELEFQEAPRMTNEHQNEPEEKPEIPDWMREAGWETQAENETSSGPGPVNGEEADGEASLEPGEVPDWLKPLAPERPEEADRTGAMAFPVTDQPETLNEEELAAMEELGDTRPLKIGQLTSQPEEEQPAFEEIEELTQLTPVNPERPDWLQSIDEPEFESPSFEAHQETMPVQLPDPDMPSWLRSLEGEADQESTGASADNQLPDWLSGVEEPAEEALQPGSTHMEEPHAPDSLLENPAEEQGLEKADLPDWLKALQEETPAPEQQTEAPAFDPTAASLISGAMAFDLKSDEPESAQWVAEEAAQAEQPAAGAALEGVELSFEEPGLEAELPDWLKGDQGEEQPADEPAAPQWPAEPPVYEGDTRPIAARKDQTATAPPPVYDEHLAETRVVSSPVFETEGQPVGDLQTEPETMTETAFTEAEPLDVPVTADEGQPAEAETPSPEASHTAETVIHQRDDTPDWLKSLFAESDSELAEAGQTADAQPEETTFEPGPGAAAEQPADVPQDLIETFAAPPLEGEPPVEIEPISQQLEAASGEETAQDSAGELDEAAVPAAEAVPTEAETSTEDQAGAIEPAAEHGIAEQQQPDFDEISEDLPPSQQWMQEEVVSEPVQQAADVDSTQVNEPERTETEEWQSEFSSEEPTGGLDINTATLQELERLPGVGYIRAQNIIAYRDEYGPYQSLEDLSNVPGIESEDLPGLQTALRVAPAETTEQPAESTQATPLEDARQAMAAGEVDRALDTYRSLFSDDRSLSAAVKDLKQAASQSRDAGLYEALGDAYMRQGKVNEAIQAYQKAEELLG